MEKVLTVTMERDNSIEVSEVLQRNSFNYMSISVYTVLCPDQSFCNIKYVYNLQILILKI
jgi:hypothetical protein